MSKDEMTSSELIRKELFSREQSKRLNAIDKAAALPPELARPLLEEGLNHWDRLLRKNCAKTLEKIAGKKVVPVVIKAYRKRLIPAGDAVDLLTPYKTSAVTKLLIEIQGTKKLKYDREKVSTYLSAVKAAKEAKETEVDTMPPAKEGKKAAGKRERLIRRERLLPLAETLNINEHVLRIAYSRWRDIDAGYNLFKVAKHSGGYREIAAPDRYLKILQRRILENILYKHEVHACCQGFRPGHSIATNALPHVGRNICINMDLKDFFPSITANRVHGLFHTLGYDSWEASFFTRLTTYNGCLPQGAPTSPAIANLICRRLDRRLSKLVEKVGASYSRYADDLTFSSNNEICHVIPLVAEIIESEGFSPAGDKLRITRKGNRQEVTGLIVNDQVAVPRHVRRKLKAVMYNLKQGKEIYWNGKKMSRASLKGHLSYLKSIHPQLGETYLGQLKNI